MTIRDKEKYMANLWDWGFLEECFAPTRIRLTDIDGMVERNGHFLWIEAKSPCAPVPRGQQIAFDRLIEDTRHTVLIIWGETNAPIRAQFWGRNEFDADTGIIQDLVRRWFEYADTPGHAARANEGRVPIEDVVKRHREAR